MDEDDPFADIDMDDAESKEAYEAKLDARLAERKNNMLQAHEAAKRAKTGP